MSAAFAVGGAITALAVHDLGFELDGNVAVTTTGNQDWASLFTVDANGNASVKSTLPANYVAATFIKDFSVGKTGALAGDTSTFSTGSKDTLNITPGWQCAKSNNLLDKNEILNAYAAALDSNGDLVIFFGFERASNNGDADVGFWFLKDDAVGCTANGGNTAFTGHHQDGDLLVVSEFTTGGDVSTIKVYEWENGATVLKADINSPEPRCDLVAAGDKACAIVNTGNLTPPWATTDKDKDNVLNPTEFFEGGINLTQLGLVSSTTCFSKFMAVTRSSQELTATLFDYAVSRFNTCGGLTAHKYHDLNANGVNDSEPALSGWRLFIDKNNDGILQPNGADGQAGTADDELFGDTNTSGDVVFSNLPGGTYRVCEVLQANWINSDPGQGTLADPDGTGLCETVTLGIAGSAYVDFGNFQAATKSGVKFKDLNADGDDENGADPRLGGWQIHLFGKDGLNRDVHLHATTSSDAATLGRYSFSVPPGSYTVCETQQAGWKQTAPATGADCSAHGGGKGYAITLTSQQVDSDNNFGNAQLYRVVVLTCDDLSTDPNNVLVDGTVTLSGQSTKATITDVPAGLAAKGVTEADLCGLGGASYGGLQQGTYTPGVEVPDVAPLFP